MLPEIPVTSGSSGFGSPSRHRKTVNAEVSAPPVQSRGKSGETSTLPSRGTGIRGASGHGGGPVSVVKVHSSPGVRPLALIADKASENKKTVVMTATSGRHISVSHQIGKHGLFTHFLLKGLYGEADSNGDASVDVRELFEFVKPQVQRMARRKYNTEQVPQLNIPVKLLANPPMKVVAGH